MGHIELVAVLTVLALTSAHARSPQEDIEENVRLSTIGLIKKYGYHAEVHTVRTDDGYILEMHRIPHSSVSPAAPGKPAVFLQHGIFGCSATWVVLGPDKGLAYILADQGYDVWMGNSRGNVYSKKHITLNPSDAKFWNFSWHELGIYDLPAMIDYVLKKVGQVDLFYIGHSQGTTAFYVMASERPEYNAKIKASFSLAPICFMAHFGISPLGLLSKANFFLKVIIVKVLHIHEILASSPLSGEIGLTLCSDGRATQFICSRFVFPFLGIEEPELNKTTMPVILGHFPSGASIHQVLHYSQLINSHKFRHYDYGITGNIQRYGQSSPPDYDLGKITAPLFLYYSEADALSKLKDVETLYDKLTNSTGKMMIYVKGFHHFDYINGIYAKSLVYENLLGHMRDIQQESQSINQNETKN